MRLAAGAGEGWDQRHLPQHGESRGAAALPCLAFPAALQLVKESTAGSRAQSAAEPLPGFRGREIVRDKCTAFLCFGTRSVALTSFAQVGTSSRGFVVASHFKMSGFCLDGLI